MCVFKYHAFIYFLRPPPWYGTCTHWDSLLFPWQFALCFLHILSSVFLELLCISCFLVILPLLFLSQSYFPFSNMRCFFSEQRTRGILLFFWKYFSFSIFEITFFLISWLTWLPNVSWTTWSVKLIDKFPGQYACLCFLESLFFQVSLRAWSFPWNNVLFPKRKPVLKRSRRRKWKLPFRFRFLDSAPGNTTHNQNGRLLAPLFSVHAGSTWKWFLFFVQRTWCWRRTGQQRRTESSSWKVRQDQCAHHG